MAKIFHDDFARLFTRALAGGAQRRTLARAAWDIAGPCQAPVGLDLQARPSPERDRREVVIKRGSKVTLQLDLELRCRKCPACLRWREVLWTTRARAEVRAAARTWFGTITLRPDEHYRMSCLAQARMASRAVAWTALTTAEQWQATHDVIGRELTKMVKRLRKESGATIRYLLVAEAHESGLPHYHMLVHEVLPDKGVSWRQLSKQWPFGFTKWKLVQQGSPAAYVCKYLGKSALARVRASVRYGNTASAIVELMGGSEFKSDRTPPIG